jgi:hypothetical protein
MAIAKIVFKNLSAKILSYTAIGGIRFYDQNNFLIDTIGAGIVKDRLRYFESEKIIATVTNTYRNRNHYNVGNAVRTDKPQTGKFGDKFYWLSSRDNQTITVTFKEPVSAISKIEFNPRPDSTYTNRGIDQPFIIEAYDENDNLIASYNVTPQYQTVNYIQTLETPELNLIVKFVLIDSDNNVYTYDYENNTLQKVSDITYDTLTKDYILENGIKSPLYITKDELIDNNIVKIVSSVQSGTNYSFVNTLIKLLPNPQLIVQKQPILLYDYESINSIKINYSGAGNIKVVLTRDFENWYTWNGTEFVLVKSGAFDINNPDDISLVLEQGITPMTLSDLTWNEIKLLYDEEPGYPDRIGFAIAIESTDVDNPIQISDIVLNVTPRAFWKDVTDECTIEQGFSTIIVTINSSGDFKINYQD